MEDNIHISARHIKLTDAIEAYINKKLAFLTRFQKYIDRIDIEISEDKAQSEKLTYEVKLIMKRGNLIATSEIGNDLYSLIDLAHDIIRLKVQKYKDLNSDHMKDKSELMESFDLEDVLVETNTTDVSYTPAITKHILYSDNRPLHPAEAIDQMEILGNNSFLFKNIESNKYAMVFRNDENGYTLIEPENS